LEDDASCEVVVIGAGVSGALIAWHLAEAGLATIVLDRRDVAHGSTAGSTGLLQYEIDTPLSELSQRLGRQRAERSYHACRESIEAIARLVKRLRLECDFETAGSLFLAANRTHVVRLRREFEARERAGFAVEWWPRSRIAAESTLPHPAAIHSRDGARIDVYRFAHGLLDRAVKKGARVYDRTTVTQTRYRPRGVELTLASGAHVKARHLVIATGYETSAFLPDKVTALHSTFAVVSEPVPALAGWPKGEPLLWETGDPYLYLRTTGDGRIMFGGYDEPFRDPAARDRMLKAKTAALHRRFNQLFPRIPIEIAYAWAGTFARTEDGLPFIGRHRAVPHTWFALGYGGNGITYSLTAAELIRDQILGRKHPDAALFGFDRKPDPRP
jgi:glycine/D-amino acid oxidase-like deaminating enzyme